MDKEQKEYMQSLLYCGAQLANLEQVQENLAKYESATQEEKEGAFAKYGYKILKDREAELIKLGKVIPATYKEYQIGVYENLVNGMYQVENNHQYGYRKENFSFPNNVPKYIPKGEINL